MSAKERPILFSGPMVRAILEGRKTQTRRVIKPVPEFVGSSAPLDQNDPACWASGWGRNDEDAFTLDEVSHCCPYGQSGDRLWVRETWADVRGMGFDRGNSAEPMMAGYSADVVPGSDSDETRKAYGVKWKPSIHMPRWASRILLEVTAVRVERINSISGIDALAEGIAPGHDVTDFKDLWDSINAERDFGWETNPWVWVVGFKRCP